MLNGSTQPETNSSLDDDLELAHKTEQLERKLKALQKQNSQLRQEFKDAVSQLVPAVNPRYEAMRRRKDAKAQKQKQAQKKETTSFVIKPQI